MRNRHAGEPFSSSDADIAAALAEVSIPTLLLSCVHMAGAQLLDGELATLRPAGLFLNEVQGYMSEEDKSTARALALGIIRDYRDRGCPEPPPVDAALLKRMMDWLVCEDVPAEYVPMLLEEMELDGHDERGTSLHSDAAARAAFPVVVVGCGMSGLLAAIRLQEAGIPYTVIEKNRRCRRNLVGEHVSRGKGRRRQSFLLLQLRASRALDRILRRPAGIAGVLSGCHGSPRDR